MIRIPSNIGGVAIEFAPGVRNEVDERVVEALIWTIPKVVVPLRPYSLYISAASDSHNYPSRHSDVLVVRDLMFKAVDVSRINGVKVGLGYPSDPFLKAIVEAIQTTFETYPHRRENFGPFFCRKLGNVVTTEQILTAHRDHIHLSVN